MLFGNETPFYLKPLPNRGLRRLDAEARQHYPGYRHPLDYSAADALRFTNENENLAVSGTQPETIREGPSSLHATDARGSSNAKHDGLTTADTGRDHRDHKGSRTAPTLPRPPRMTTLSGRAMPGTSGTGYTKADPVWNPCYNITEAERLHPSLSPTDRLKHERLTDQEKASALLEMRRRRTAEREAFFVQRQREETSRAEEKARQLAGTSMKNVESEGRNTITHTCFTVEAQREKDWRDAAGRHQYFARQREVDRRLNANGYNVLTWQPRPEVQVPPAPSHSAAAAHEVNVERFE